MTIYPCASCRRCFAIISRDGGGMVVREMPTAPRRGLDQMSSVKVNPWFNDPIQSRGSPPESVGPDYWGAKIRRPGDSYFSTEVEAEFLAEQAILAALGRPAATAAFAGVDVAGPWGGYDWIEERNG